METSKMSDLFGEFILNIMEYLADKPNSHWNTKSCWRISQVIEPELKLKNYSERKLFLTLKYEGYFANRAAQEWQQTWKFDNTTRCNSH